MRVETMFTSVMLRLQAMERIVDQGFHPDLGWRDLAEAAYVVAGGALWVATNTDKSIPQQRGIAPGNGSLVAAVTAATLTIRRAEPDFTTGSLPR